MTLIFPLMFGLVLGLVHYYLWRRLVRDTLPPGRGRRVATTALVVLYALMVSALVVTRITPTGSAWLAWPGYLWLAVAFYAAVLLAVLEIPRLLLNRTVGRRERTAVPVVAGAPAPAPEQVPEPAPKPVVDPGRRLFIARSLAVASGLAAGGVVGYGATQALGDPRINRVPVKLAKLDSSLAGFRIAVVSDIHLGPLLGRAHTERIVRTINRLEPDLVAIVGDLVDGTVAQLGEAAAPLRDLSSAHGSFFVTGNHEYYSGHEQWITELERLGVNALRNERVRISRGNAFFELAGVNDVTGEQSDDAPDLARALDGRDERQPVVLLAHQPVQVREAARMGVDLQLSGHTHGGQMFPFTLAVPLQQPVTSGLATVDGTQVYVSNGAGFWGPPVRVGAPPEVALVELHHNFAIE
ncbi:metallophosphoesterase [Saccharothrix coeruleofusca]|uniref:Metallophosphatase n=1 Tax=Saccharothrix coeruleofusca TaxID=33919 RepID=A0A918AKT7_9PSEU|nr:metallophosphoesterase [Saccharothrix coeruleofusca]GGP49850.1 metallophosphatase [Saccharothrix coeruleofusca]